MLRPSRLPYRGVSDAVPFIAQRGDSVPLSAMRNIWPSRTARDRIRLQTRPGLSKAFTQQIGGGARVQGLGVIARASSVVSYEKGSCALFEGDSRQVDTLLGQLWGFDKNPGQFLSYYMDATVNTGPANNVINALDVDTTGLVVCSSNFMTAASGSATRVDVVNPVTGMMAASRTSVSGPFATRFYNTIKVGPTLDNGVRYLFACGFRRLDIYRLDDLSLTLLGTNDLDGWAWDLVECGWYRNGSTFELFVAFNGSEALGTYANGVGSGAIDGGIRSLCFRSGIMRFRINNTTATPLTRLTFGTQLTPASDYYEANHGYWRLSEQTPYKPNGAILTGLDVRSDGRLLLTKTNQGWGPNAATAAFRPDGNKPYYTTVCISPQGAILWLTDTNSALEVGDGGYINDIPTGGGDDPSVLSCRWGADQNAYVAGRSLGSGASIRKLRANDGLLLWGTKLQGSGAHRQAAMCRDLADGNIIVAGDRNTDWAGSDGAQAHLWKLNAINGSVIWSLDLNEAVSALCCGSNIAGNVYYGTDKVT